MTPATVKTKSRRNLSEADLERLAEEAERGFDLSTWKPRPGRPSLGAAAAGEHSPRIEARVPEPLHRRVVARAAKEGRSVSAVVRQLLEDYAREP
ncbi:MAG: ribbon-helix-helix protein, CopG family [Candidatus Limnocylindrales bacterium]